MARRIAVADAARVERLLAQDEPVIFAPPPAHTRLGGIDALRIAVRRRTRRARPRPQHAPSLATVGVATRRLGNAPTTRRRVRRSASRAASDAACVEACRRGAP